MRKLFIITTVVFTCCMSKPAYEPAITGETITHEWQLDSIRLNINEQISVFKLPANDSVDYSDPVWLNKQDAFLMTQYKKDRDSCYNYQIVLFDTKGNLLDTVFTPPPCTIVDVMPSPNDSLLLVRTYLHSVWRQQIPGIAVYLVLNIASREVLHTVKHRTYFNLGKLVSPVWSSDSKRFLEFDADKDGTQLAYFHELNVAKNIVGTGKNFIFSPTDVNTVAYLKDNTIFFKNISTNAVVEFYKGEKEIINFFWHPKGEYLLVNTGDYYLNIKKDKLWSPSHIFISVPDKKISRELPHHIVFDSWR